MAEKLDPEELVSIEALTVSGMWEIAALVEVLERKGILTKKDVLDMIQELRRQNPAAVPTPDTIPEPYLNVQVENALIDRIMDLLNATTQAHWTQLEPRVREKANFGWNRPE